MAIRYTPDGVIPSEKPVMKKLDVEKGKVVASLKEMVASMETPVKKNRMVSVTIRLSPEVVEYFKASGKGWQPRINQVLLDHVKSNQS